MTTMTETQNVIVFKAINLNKDIIPSLAFAGLTCDARAYGNAVAGLVKKGFAEQSGTATTNDYSKDGWRFRLTKNGIFAFEDQEDEESLEQIEELQAELAEQEEEEESEELAGSRIKEQYKQKYAQLKELGGSGQGCADALDQWMIATFMVPAPKGNRDVLDLPSFEIMARQNEVNIDKYLGLNVGMIRMNVTNVLRGRLRKGLDVIHHGVVVVKGLEQAKPDFSALVDAVREHAQTNYAKAGWDYVIETWEDKDIIEEIVSNNAKTPVSAIRAVGRVVKAMDSQRKDIEATAF